MAEAEKAVGITPRLFLWRLERWAKKPALTG